MVLDVAELFGELPEERREVDLVVVAEVLLDDAEGLDVDVERELGDVGERGGLVGLAVGVGVVFEDVAGLVGEEVLGVEESAGFDVVEEAGGEVLAERDHDDVAAAALERLDERDVVAVAGDEDERADVLPLPHELERVDAELEVGGVPVHRRGDEAGVDPEEVERALDVAGVVVEAGEVRVGVADGDGVALVGEPLAEGVEHVEDVVAGGLVVLDPVLEVVIEVLVIDQHGGAGGPAGRLLGVGHRSVVVRVGINGPGLGGAGGQGVLVGAASRASSSSRVRLWFV